MKPIHLDYGLVNPEERKRRIRKRVVYIVGGILVVASIIALELMTRHFEHAMMK